MMIGRRRGVSRILSGLMDRRDEMSETVCFEKPASCQASDMVTSLDECSCP